jgi:hypothetical protein
MEWLSSGRSFADDLKIMFRRHATLIVRDPVLYLDGDDLDYKCCVCICLLNVLESGTSPRKWQTNTFSTFGLLGKLTVSLLLTFTWEIDLSASNCLTVSIAC